MGIPVQIELSEAGAVALPTIEAPAPLLQRALARARIEAMGQELRALRPDANTAREALEQRIVALSTQARVVSDLTALLVLETAEDYRRFGIAQDARTDILQVGEQGLELLQDPTRAPMEVPKAEDSKQVLERPFTADLPRPSMNEQAERPADELAGATPMPPRKASDAEAKGRAVTDTGEAKRRARADSAEAPSVRAPPLPSSKPSASAPQIAAEPSARPGMRKAAADPSADVGRGTGSGSDRAGSVVRRSAVDEAPETRTEVAAPVSVVSSVRVSAQVRSAVGVPATGANAVVRRAQGRAQACFSTSDDPDRQTLVLVLDISDKGVVRSAVVASSTLRDAGTRGCLVRAYQSLRFAKPEAGSGQVELSLSFAREQSFVSVVREPSRRPGPRKVRTVPAPTIADAYEGELAAVLEALKRGEVSTALARASAAHQREPGDVMALIALGETLEAQRDLARAARVYGSLIDLFPARPDLRRMAGARLERLQGVGLALAIDSYLRAVDQRPDHPSGHRLLAYALLQHGQAEQAFRAMERALDQNYPSDRFEGVDRILREDLCLLGSAWLRTQPAAEAQIRSALDTRGLKLDVTPSLRFVLTWETDANDVDFHIYDGRGGHAFYMQPKLPSGGALFADVTTGFGPECFAIPGAARAYPYTLQAHYFSRGPMGYGMGKLEVIEHDGKGGVKLAEHPFVIMKDKAFVQLTKLTAALP